MLVSESDRGLVILLASFIEDALFERILRELSSGEKLRKRLVKGGPLRTFEHRLLMAQALGVLNEREAAQIDVFRSMRNACSHSRKDISFETPELLEALTLLMRDEAAKEIRAGEAGAPRGIFMLCAAYMLSVLQYGSHDLAQATLKRIVDDMPENPTGHLETAEVLLASLQKTQIGSPAQDLVTSSTSTGRSTEP